MKFGLSSRQPYEILKQADEIKFDFRDRKAIPDFAERYPNHDIILYHTYLDEEINWTDLTTYNTLCREKFYLCSDSLHDLTIAKEKNIKFFHRNPVKTYYDLKALKNLGVSYVYLDAPLFFQMDRVKTFDIPIRLIPNLVYNDGLPRENGIYGTWVRPDDLETYGYYVAVVEFARPDKEEWLTVEKGLFNVYKKDKMWIWDLNDLILNLNYHAENHLIPSDFSLNRLNCGQRCQENGRCNLCKNMLDLASAELVAKLIDKN